MVDVTNGSDVHVGLAAVELFLRHDFSSPIDRFTGFC
jgi:hypothetical protein